MNRVGAYLLNEIELTDGFSGRAGQLGSILFNKFPTRLMMGSLYLGNGKGGPY